MRGEVEMGPCPQNSSKIRYNRMGEKYRCVSCGINYPIAEENWTETKKGTYCNGCVWSKEYLNVPKPIFVEITERPIIDDLKNGR